MSSVFSANSRSSGARSPRLEGADRGEQVAVHRDVPVARLDQRRHGGLVEADADAVAVRVAAEAGHGARAHARDQPPHHRDRILAAGGAAGTPRAHEPQRALRRLGEVAEARVGAGHRIGAVEHERAEPVAVVDGERLGGEGAVGVAVEVDAPDPQRVEHGGDVVDRGAGAVEVAPRAELARAAPGAPHVVLDRAAQRRDSPARRRGRSRAGRRAAGRAGPAAARAGSGSCLGCRSWSSRDRPRSRASCRPRGAFGHAAGGVRTRSSGGRGRRRCGPAER